MKVVLIGRGKVGIALARSLRAAGHQVHLLAGRSTPGRTTLAKAAGVVLCVPDAAIEATAARLLGALAGPTPVLHVAGARTDSELELLRTAGHPVGAMHPMVSFAPGSRLPGFEGTVFVVGGDARAVRFARELVRSVGAGVVRASVHGPSYHAAAALVANGSVGLAHQSVGLLVRLGLARRDAERAVAGLLGTVARNVAQVGVPRALTGPIVRGDAATVSRHRRVLAAADADALDAYDGSAGAVLRCAVDAGLDPAGARAVARALGEPLTPPRRPRGAARTPARSPKRRR